MYKLFNFLFGWDYICWKNSADQGIARIHKSPDGSVFYWRYKNIYIADKILNPSQVLWLTCKPEKYLENGKIC